MSEPVTIWKKHIQGSAEPYSRVIYFDPKRPSEGKFTESVDYLRRAKHLTDAEMAALMWHSHFIFMTTETGPDAAEEARRGLVIERFATHDQAV